MKTSNVEPHGLHATAATRGQRSALAAGSKGMMWRDASTESVGQIRDMTVYGLEFIDHEDGTGELHVGGPGGVVDPGGDTGGDGTGAASVPIYMLNNSGVNLDQGAVVVVDDTADNAVTRTTTAGSTLIVGIVQEPIEAGAIGPVLFNGYAGEVEVTGTVVRGDYLETSTTAGVAQASATREAGTFGVATAAADLSLISDSAITEQDASVTSLTITMPASVTDPDSAGRVLFLALWRDPSVTSDPTITGWTRIGSTSGFWYYQRICTVGDTASASWTTASPAAAIVALLHPTVASLEDFDYDATNSAASITGLDGSPHYALAVLQGAVALPAGWTALPSAAIAFDPSGVTDLALAGTVTNDPANTMDWANPAYVNDGNETTYAEFLPHAAGETFRLKLDLGSAGVVSEAWVRTAYEMTLQYSTDDVTYTTPPGSNWAATTTHNGAPTYRRVTWTGGDITARYWRLGRTSAGSGSGETISTWELTGTHELNVEGMLVGQYVGRATTITSPFSGAAAATDGVFVFNLHVEPKPSAILYGPDLGAGSAPTADDVAYDNTTSGLTATDVQAAIDEVVAGGGSGPLNNFAATGAPTVNDDSGDGYSVGSRWIDVTNDRAWVCVDATTTAAVWLLQPGGGSGGGWIAYTPVWTASSINPTLSNGSIQGNYRYLDAKTIVVRIRLTIGSSTNLGSGNYSWSLPLTTDSVDEQSILCRIFRASGSLHQIGVGNVQASSTVIARAGTNNNIIAHGTPFAWTTGDQIRFQGVIGIA